MSSLFNTKLRNSRNLIMSKNEFKRLFPQNNNSSLKNRQRDLSFNHLNKNDTSQQILTQRFITQNEQAFDKLRTDYDSRIIPSLDYNDFSCDRTLNTYYKTINYRKKPIRTKSAVKTKTYKILSDPKYFNNSMSTFKYYHKNFKKKNKKEYQGVPVEFIKSMRLDVDANIIEARKFLFEEKKRIIKKDPKFRYYFLTNRNNKKRKDEEMKKIEEYRLRIENRNKNKKKDEGFKLNAYYAKLSLKETEYNFNVDRPMIDKSKFSPKFIMYKNTDEIKKEHPLIDVRNIFSTIVYDKFFTSQNIKKVKLSKSYIYKKFISSIKKCAIEFKNIIIPFSEYIIFYNKSKNLSEQLLGNEYQYLIRLIKKEKNSEQNNSNDNHKNNKNIYDKDKEVCKFLPFDLTSIFIIDFLGQTILYLAVKYKLYNSMTKIIKYGANVNNQDFKGKTSLHYAVIYKDITSVIILIYFLANPLIKDKNEKCALDYIIKDVNNDDKRSDNYIIKEILIRSSIIRKNNKYRSWREFDVYIRRGIQFYLSNILSKERYDLIFSYIENPVMYYK